METIMWSKMLPLLRLLHFVSDNWERVAKYVPDHHLSRTWRVH